MPRSEAFVFGSPNPQHRLSNVQFRNAAQSVLDEMNARLEADGIAGVDMEVLKCRQQSMSAQPSDDDAQQEKKAGSSIGAAFDKAHQAQFDKMDSITNHYAARRGLSSKPDPAPVLGKRKSSAAPLPIAGKTRKSSVVVKKDRVPSNSSVKLRTNPKKGVPGGFGDEDDDDGSSEQEEGDREHKRVCIDPIDEAEREREEAKKLKEREAIRRKLDANKAKRRSSMGRPSMSRGIVRKSDASIFRILSETIYIIESTADLPYRATKANVTLGFLLFCKETSRKCLESRGRRVQAHCASCEACGRVFIPNESGSAVYFFQTNEGAPPQGPVGHQETLDRPWLVCHAANRQSACAIHKQWQTRSVRQFACTSN